MADNSKPPFRADQVGSLLRPAELAERRRMDEGRIPQAAYVYQGKPDGST